MHDLVVRGGRVIDGTGADAFGADVAVSEGRIAEVGADVGPGRREIDADGLVVMPGFVDAHTHYDGQVTWDPDLTPSSWHGVTTVVMGNCGSVGCTVFPADIVRPSRRWAASRFTRLVHFAEAEVGGHFAALEEPGIFVQQVRACATAIMEAQHG